MKKLAALIAAWGFFAPSLACSADLGTYGTTIVRIEEQSVPGFPGQRVVPATQFLGVDSPGLADGNLSLHLFGWGRADLADRSAGDRYTDGELAYGYLRYLFPNANGELKAGRFLVREGVANEQLDGIGARADLAGGFGVSLYGGAPVRLGTAKENRGDFLAGGRGAFRLANRLELGVSVLHEKGAASRRFTPASGNAAEVEDFRQLVGADLWLSPLAAVELSGHTFYNTAVSSLAEHSYQLRVRPANGLLVAVSYDERLFKGYFADATLPETLFRPDPRDSSRAFGASVTLAVGKPLEMTADYRHNRRDTLGSTDRYGLEGRMRLAQSHLQGGVAYHRTDAPDTASPAPPPPSFGLSFHEVRGWLLHDRGKYYVSLDAIGHFFDDSHNVDLNNKSTAFEIAASAGYRPVNGLTVAADLSYGSNSRFAEEVKGLVRVDFAYSTSDRGGNR